MGMIHFYYGDGKGKTTAAIGLSVRAKGHGKSVLFVQYLKGMPTGEISSLTQLDIEVKRVATGTKFVFAMNQEEKQTEASVYHAVTQDVIQLCAQGNYDLVVLDEITDAVSVGLLSEEQLMQLVHRKDPHVELIVTGHEPNPFLIDSADYVTHMCAQKHPYERGISAREGIEY